MVDRVSFHSPGMLQIKMSINPQKGTQITFQWVLENWEDQNLVGLDSVYTVSSKE